MSNFRHRLRRTPLRHIGAASVLALAVAGIPAVFGVVSFALPAGVLLPWLLWGGLCLVRRLRIRRLWRGTVNGQELQILERRGWLPWQPAIREIAVSGGVYSRALLRRGAPAKLFDYFQAAVDEVFRRTPDAAFLMLGLGGGGIPRYALEHYPGARVTAVELEPEIVELARRFFLSDQDWSRFRIVTADAADFVTDPESEPGGYELICCDLFCGLELASAVYSPELWTGCRRLLAPGGMAMANLLNADAVRLTGMITAVCREFAAVELLVRRNGQTVLLVARRIDRLDGLLTSGRIGECRRLLSWRNSRAAGK